MAKQKTEVQGLAITIEEIQDADYISLTDIEKQSNQSAGELIRSWMKNGSTLEFLEMWELLNNPDFKGGQMTTFRLKAIENRIYSDAV